MKDSKFWNTVKRFNTSSIFSRYLTLSLTMVIIPLLALGASFLLYNNHRLNSEYKLHEKTVNEKIAASFDDIVDSVNETYLSMDGEEGIRKFFYLTEYSGLAAYNNIAELTETLSDGVSTNSNIDSIYIYNEPIGYLKGSNLSNFHSKLLDYSWYSILKSNSFNDYLTLRKGLYANREVYYITLCRNVYMSKQYLGSYVFNITPSAVTDRLSAVADIEKILITDENENVIYCNHPEFFTVKMEQIEDEYRSEIKTVSKSKYGYNIYTTTSKYLYDRQFSFYAIIIGLVFVLILLCSIVTAFILSKHFYKSILDIIGILQQNETENYNSKKENEYEFIQRSILSMKDNKSSIEQELAEKLSLLKTYQLKTLQEQINPHFLNNTLNLIGLLDVAEHKKQTKIYTLIKLLSDLLSGIIDTSEYIIPLEKELEYTRKYLDIQNIKYNNKFDVKINADKDVLKMSVLKFMLQPIVENAIIHGILGTRARSGSIIIDAYKENDFLIVRVTNDQNTIEQTKLNTLRKNLEENVPPESKHIGLLNVNQRLNLVFGKTSSCTVSCNYFENTTSIILSIPANPFDM